MSPARPDGVRPLAAADLDWVLGLAEVRRERLRAHAPRFWRPAPGVAERERGFVTRLLEDPAALAVRTDRGYLVAPAPTRGPRVLGDVDVVGDWAAEGTTLLRHAVGTGPVRLVAPVAEPDRRAAGEQVGLQVTSTWWHRDLPLTQVRAEAGRVELSAPGATGRLVEAPPVHDPGGPLLLVTAVTDAAGLTAIEAAAAERGATVAVVAQRPDDLMRELLLVGAGYVRTTDFLEST